MFPQTQFFSAANPGLQQGCGNGSAMGPAGSGPAAN